MHGNEKQREKLFKIHGGITSGPYTFVKDSLGWQLENLDFKKPVVENIQKIKGGLLPKRDEIFNLYKTEQTILVK